MKAESITAQGPVRWPRAAWPPLAQWLCRLAVATPLACAALGAAAQTDTPATWAFTPPRDEFSADSLLDLRSLNERTAGETGFVRVDARGDFIRGDGQPIRFWAVNSDVAREPFVAKPRGPKTAPDLARHARFLAKRGVNLVRQHRQISPPTSAAIGDINGAERDAIWRMVAAMRTEGIYSVISPYWAVPMKFSKDWAVAGGADQSALGLLFFDPTLQAAYKSWLKQLFTEKNPYNGVPLARDASVALVQIQNEDSLLFWTVGGIKGPQRAALEARFAQFVMAKHGSLAKALAAWGGERIREDAPDEGRLALINLWELTQNARGARALRLADQTEFYARTMHDFNSMIVSYLRDELGVGSLINAGNWKTASAVRLGDVERWSYTAADVDAANVYTGGWHEGPHRGWALVPGDRYTSQSVLRNPKLLPINLKQTLGRPMLVTEGAWVMPNAYAAEGPFLISAYASLTGIDGYFWFSTGDEGWSPPQSANGFLPSQQKWTFATPEMLGSFPAAALAYRRGDVQRGAPVVVENRALADLWARKTPVIAEEPSYDPNRDSGDIAERSNIRTGVPAEAFLSGPVHIAFGADPAKSSLAPLAKLITADALRSNTGEIVMSPPLGRCTVDAPRVQGVAAHFDTATATTRLSDVQFTSRNSYGAAMAISLDDEPLRRSRRVLVQYATQSRPTGWAERPATWKPDGKPSVSGLEITSIGSAPWRVVSAQLEVVIDNPALTTATALDMNGMPIKDVPLRRNAQRLEFSFPDSAMYVVLR